MKIVNHLPSFQGDICIRRVNAIPASAKPVPKDGEYIVVAHSETGHHHVIESRAAQMLIGDTNAFIAWLDVAETTELRHLREYDTHESYQLPPGKYEIRRQREYVPQGWRRAAD